MSSSECQPPEVAPKEWRNFAGVFERLRAPLRPTAGDVAHVRHAIAGNDARVLLLGVTPELAELGEQLVAIDNSPRMLAQVWPGDSAGRRAVLGDWASLPFEAGAFDSVIGDGSLNSAPEVVKPVLREVRRVLAQGGKAVFRTFCSPDAPETLASIRHDVDAGWSGNVHALKWRLAMVLAASIEDAIVPVREILAAFNAMFPDRAELASKTGWSFEEISTLDAYDGADHSLGFPTLRRVLDTAAPFFSSVAVVPGGGYPLAERCPTIAWSVD